MFNLAFPSCASLLLSLLIPSASAQAQVAATLHITNAVVAPDGFERVAIVVENSFLGPLIQGAIVSEVGHCH